MITKLAFGLLAVLVLTLATVVAIRQDRIEQQRHVEKAKADCAAMGGELLMSYSYNSDSFYISGCKLGR